jgi:hypothetical protein
LLDNFGISHRVAKGRVRCCKERYAEREKMQP